MSSFVELRTVSTHVELNRRDDFGAQALVMKTRPVVSSPPRIDQHAGTRNSPSQTSRHAQVLFEDHPVYLALSVATQTG